MPIRIAPPRARLLILLRKQLNSLEGNASPDAMLLRALLSQAVEGLVALNYGEAQSIFAPAGKGGAHDGTKPYTLRKMRMRAQGFADLLIEHDYQGEATAIRTVAGAYGVKADRFRKWRLNKHIGKTTDKLMKSFREEVAKLPWDEAKILESLKAEGAKYRQQYELAHKSTKK